MRRIRRKLPLLLSDERSAVRRKAASLLALVVLGTAAAGLILMSFSEQTYQDQSRRVLRASQDLPGGPLV